MTVIRGFNIWAVNKAQATNVAPYQYGDGSITGTVKEQGVIVPYRKVHLYERKTRLLARVTKSDASGQFVFDHTNADYEYFVLSLDDNFDATQYNAVIQDKISGNYDALKSGS